MAEIDTLSDWLDANRAQKGTPDFDSKLERYRVLKTEEQGGTAPAAAAPAPAGGNPFADKIQQLTSTAAANNAANPGGFDATTGRIITGAVAGIPDLAISIRNAAARAGGQPEEPLLGPRLNEATGGAPMPENAGVTRQLAEGAGSALLGGGANAVRAAITRAPSWLGSIIPSLTALTRSTVAPTVGSHYGSDLGGTAAEALKLDPQTGALLGSILGGAASSAAAPGAARYSHERFARQAGPNAPEIAAAAERQGVRPTAGMLGNADIQGRERTLAGQGGARSFIEARRSGARNDIAAALDRAAEARGATTAQPTPGTIGYDTANVARLGSEQLAAESSRGQQDLMNRIGPRAPADVSGILAALDAIRNRTDPGTAAPIAARVGTLEQMLPPIDPATGVRPHTDVPYERLKDWRTGLRERSQGYDPVPGRYAGEIYDATTGAMRDTAASQGVPPGFFDTIQGRTARTMGEGGPHETLSAISDQAQPMTAYNYLRRGEQEPGRLRTLEATGQPGVSGIMGDYLRLLGNNTISSPNLSARGPAQLATALERMHPEALDVIAGAQRPAVQDVATLARSFDYPTSQTGLTRSIAPLSESAVKTAIGSEALGRLAGLTGIPGASAVGQIAGLATNLGLRNLQARRLEGPTAINALSGGAAPEVMSMSDLVAALTAAQSQRPQ